MIKSLDHIVLTVKDIDVTCAFYEALGMTRETFGAGRTALKFGEQKINLHELGKEFEPKAQRPTSGSADLCFLTDVPVETLAQQFGNAVVEGPIQRTGAKSKLNSIYLRDPDLNLIEISNEIGG